MACYISRYTKPYCYLPEGLLKDLAPELINSSAEDPILTSDNAFRIFVTWLLYRDLDNVKAWSTEWLFQISLAEAWTLGAKYHIPAFQNEVMQMLFLDFTEEHMYTETVGEAYRTTKRNTKLQQACVARIVMDNYWSREDYTEFGLSKIPGFCLDVAVRFHALNDERIDTSTDIENFLVDEDGEDGEDEEDEEDEESVTEG